MNIAPANFLRNDKNKNNLRLLDNWRNTEPYPPSATIVYLPPATVLSKKYNKVQR